MNTLINKPNLITEMGKKQTEGHFQLMTFIFLLLSFVLFSSMQRPLENSTKSDDVRNKKLEILIKLESGEKISSEDIRASLGNFSSDDNEDWIYFFPEFPGISEFHGKHSLPGPFYYYDYNGRGRISISDNDIREIHNRLSSQMEELRKNIESFRNSEDFIIIQNELKEWNENFRKELEKMKEDLIKSGKETRSKGTVQTLM